MLAAPKANPAPASTFSVNFFCPDDPSCGDTLEASFVPFPKTPNRDEPAKAASASFSKSSAPNALVKSAPNPPVP